MDTCLACKACAGQVVAILRVQRVEDAPSEVRERKALPQAFCLLAGIDAFIGKQPQPFPHQSGAALG
ncbi:hypothetical protein, partial [Rhizobium leguminosarum]|uniref:hypothetical protein n=1 Tax=Rhizobium leguminosarum TaxID=384 RepID=UPI003F987A19